MSAVHITAVNVLDNPAPFLNPLQFEIHYECLGDLQEGVCQSSCITSYTTVACFLSQSPVWHADLQWKLIYVGSAESEKFDQVLDDVEVGPVRRGKYKFVLQVCTACAIILINGVPRLGVMLCPFAGGRTET